VPVSEEGWRQQEHQPISVSFYIITVITHYNKCEENFTKKTGHPNMDRGLGEFFSFLLHNLIMDECKDFNLVIK